MKKLPRQIIRNEDKPEYSKQIWQPSWKCHCCRDTGIVSNHLAVKVIEGFNHRTDQVPYCQNPDCKAGEHLLANEAIENTLDMRLNAAICQELDLIERQDWQQTLHQQFQNQRRVIAMVEQLAGEKSLRQRDRSPEEEQVASRRHQENLLLTPTEQDKLRAALYGGEP